MISNVGIKVLNEEHGKKVIEWFKSQGADTYSLDGSSVGSIYWVGTSRLCRVNTEEYIQDHTNVKITTLPEELPKDWYIQIIEENFRELEATFRKITGNMKQEPQIPDFTVKGTKLPSIPNGTEYRVVGWESYTKHERFDCTRSSFLSYGSKTFGEEVYILAEKSSYAGHLYYMIKQSDVERLWKKQNSQTQVQKEMKQRNITPEQAQSIIDIACTTWTGKLADKWAKEIVTKKPIEISEEFYQEMRKECTGPQNDLFDQIFGKDDGSVDLSHLNPKQVQVATDRLLDVRDSDEFVNKAFWLNGNYNWEIKKDSKREICLIPTKKK